MVEERVVPDPLEKEEVAWARFLNGHAVWVPWLDPASPIQVRTTSGWSLAAYQRLLTTPMLWETMSSRRGTSPRYPPLRAAAFAATSSESAAGAITDLAARTLAIV